jgi:Phospholipase_D-nuclease N-terminal
MRPFTRFNILLAILSIILVIAGAAMLGKYEYGYYVLFAGFLAAIIFSITSIIDVFKARHLREGRKMLWLIMVICVPVFGGLLYYGIEYGKSSRDVLSTPDSEDKF